jgi:uncharacterized membrane protein YhiD involved in acid resistance
MDLHELFATTPRPPADWISFLVRLLAAAVLGALVSYRPWRLLLAKQRPVPVETSQSQGLIAVAGAMMVLVIGDNLARAFGLVGLGAFIRFRSGVKDPRDAATLFVMIGIGMACGLGLLRIALLAAAFTAVILFLLDATTAHPGERVRVAVELTDARGALAAIRGALPGNRVLRAPSELGAAGTIVLELVLPETVDAAALADQLQRRGVAGVRSVELLDD